MNSNVQSREKAVVLIHPGCFVKTIFNSVVAHKVLAATQVGNGVQIKIETHVAGQRSETLIRGTEVAEIIDGDNVTVLRSASIAERSVTLKEGATMRTSHLFEPAAESPAVSIKVKPAKQDGKRLAIKPDPAAPVAEPAAADPKPAGDYVTELLARMPYRDVAAALGMDVAALDAKYAHLDAPKQRMCFGNLIRARYRKDPGQFSQFN